MIFTHRTMFYACLSSGSHCGRCRWYNVPDKLRLFWLREIPKDPHFEPHARIKMAQVLGSPAYIYDACKWSRSVLRGVREKKRFVSWTFAKNAMCYTSFFFLSFFFSRKWAMQKLHARILFLQCFWPTLFFFSFFFLSFFFFLFFFFFCRFAAIFFLET